MDHHEFNQYCASLPASTYVMQWRGAHVWKIGGKVFAIGFTLKDDKPAFTFKTSEQNYYFLHENDAYRPAPYFANRGMKWIQQTQASACLDEDLKYYLFASYQLVSAALSKRKQSELGLL